MIFVKKLRTRQQEKISNVYPEYTVWGTHTTKQIFKAEHQYYLFFESLLTQLGVCPLWFGDPVAMVSTHHYMTPCSPATSGLPDFKSHRQPPLQEQNIQQFSLECFWSDGTAMISLAWETNTRESNTNVDRNTYKCCYDVLECDGN